MTCVMVKKKKFIPTSSVRLLVTLSVGIVIGVGLQTGYNIDHLFEKLGDDHHGNAFDSETLTVEEVIPENFQGKLSLFILAGQSNIAGRGEMPEFQQTNSNVFVFGNDYRWKVALEPVVK